MWSVGTEEREVAVKSLADGSTEEKRIQFLQEAAIMGQFKHPNVITLHGVLLDQEPVSNKHMTLLCNFHTMHNTIYSLAARCVSCLHCHAANACSGADDKRQLEGAPTHSKTKVYRRKCALLQ